MLLPAATLVNAVEFEVLDKFTVDGASIFNSTATIIVPTTQSTELWVSTSVTTPHLFVSTTGNVGLGTGNPVASLDVAGGIKVGTVTANCTSAIAGTIRWYDGHVSVCNGSDWRQLDNPSPPTVSSISPSSGIISGGNAITISGSGFNLGLFVLIGGAPATAIVLTGTTQIAATIPAGTAGEKEVKITNPDGQSCTSAFTYNPLPTITSISPNSGPIATNITITGTGFETGAGVTIGNVAAANITWVSATQIIATTPARSTSGAQDVTVTNPDTGSVTNTGGFTYTVYATGGDITNVGGYRIHTFTSDGTFTVATGGNVEVLVVAGGGAGGAGAGGSGGGGGGAGGLIYEGAHAVTTQAYPIMVGNGGPGVPGGSGNKGNNSSFDTITAHGGGGGTGLTVSGNESGGSGGAGRGGVGSGGAGISGEGYAGGTGLTGGSYPAGGGGGKGGVGQSAPDTSHAGNGGPGFLSSISGTATAYAAGGGGSADSGTPGAGGAVSSITVGGAGRTGVQGGNGENGVVNTGSGGGGAHGNNSGGSGGSGIVIIRYPL